MADLSCYSPLKVIHHQDRIQQLKDGKQTVPLQVHLVISDLCNHDCSFCAYRWSGYSSNQLFTVGSELAKFGTDNPMRMLPYEKIIEILDDCKEMGIKAVQVTGGGEPLVHPKHIDIFNAVVDRGLNLALVTNGSVFRDGFIDVMLKAQWVRFSIDAGNKHTYAKIRRISESGFDVTWNRIRLLAQAKNRAESTDLIIGVGFVVTKDNWKEVLECTERAKMVGADNVRISAVFQPDNDAYFRDFYKEAATLCRQAETLQNENFRVFNNFGERLSDLKETSPDYSFCGYQQLATYIGGDHNVYRCCVQSYNEHGLIGSLKNQRFKDLWNSQEKKDNFDKFDAHSCDRCMFNNKNRNIAYVINHHPSHVNFV
jgi:MoaA/NifB/PqqE/SkfB family radical SAM enzyme